LFAQSRANCFGRRTNSDSNLSLSDFDTDNLFDSPSRIDCKNAVVISNLPAMSAECKSTNLLDGQSLI
jgi:hypothetical protein